MLAQTDIPGLRERAVLMVGSDFLLSEESRNAVKAWINQTAADEAVPEADRRLALALYIITERKPS